MESGVFCSAVVSHSPRIANEDTAPEFLKGVIAGEKEFSKYIAETKPDVLIVQSTHWVSTFNWYATIHKQHKGFCVGDECPDMIPGMPYDRPGDKEFGEAIADSASDAGIPFYKAETPHFVWDYGSFVPLSYIDPGSSIPVILIPICLSAEFDECHQVGVIIDKVARSLNRRAMFLASTALAHKLSRGPEIWPSDERREKDRQLIEMMCSGEISKARTWLPEYSREVYAEGGGRPLATLLGTLDEKTHKYAGKQFGPYGQSSGSGNATVAVWREE